MKKNNDYVSIDYINTNIITPVLANETEVTTDISIQRETSLLIQRYKRKIV